MEHIRKIKYFEYSRKSSEGEDRQVQSIERQREENRRTIAQHNLLVVDSFHESRSAMTPNNRPVFDEMIRRIKKGEANGIVCWHINRLSRNPLEAGIIQQMLSDGLIQSIQTKDKEYLPSDNLIVISVEAGMSSQYSKDLGRSVKSGIEKKIAKGMAPISAPMGYLNTKHYERGANFIIKDPDRFDIMRKAWELMLTGMYTPPHILAKLTNDYGLRTRKTKHKGDKPLSRSSIYRIFTDPFYAGLFVYRGVTYQGTHAAMVTLEEYDKVQLLLGREGRPRPKKHTFTYTGIMKCGECGSAITACQKTKIIKKTGEVKTYILYHCTRRKKGGENCSQRFYMPVEELEALIVKELATCAISPKFLEFALEEINQDNKVDAGQEQEVRDSLAKEISKLEREVKNLLSMRLNEAISDDEYKTERTDREYKALRLKQKIQQSQDGENSIIRKSQKRLKSIVQMDSRFNKANPLGKKAIFLSLGGNYTIKDKKLFVSKHKWLIPLTANKKLVESHISRLELENTFTPQRKKEVSNLIRPLVRALMDEVRREQLDGTGISLENLAESDVSSTSDFAEEEQGFI